MDKRVKYTYKQKLRAVRSVIGGHDSSESVANKIGSQKTTVQRWVNLYSLHGASGLKLRHGSYTGQFKIGVIRYLLKNNLSLRSASAMFGVPKDHTVGKWLRKYEQEGVRGLLEEARGRKKITMAKTPKKEKKSSTPTDEKLAALQSEVEYLRAENAFLKKLDALVQEEKEAKAQSKRPKPSKN